MSLEKPHPYRYTSVFTSSAKVAAIADTDRFVAKASLQPLKGIIPSDVNPENEPDLLYISSNGAVAGLINKNGDGITAETALKIHKTARNKYISTDHDREKVVGVVLFPALTKMGTNEVITEEEAAKLDEPFNMAFAGVLWKAIQPMLTKYLAKTGDSLDSDALSMSWEICFDKFNIGVGSKNLWDAKVYTDSDPEFRDLEQCLRSNGGRGKDKNGNDVFRIIDGDAIILGYSIVQNPAASVKGILPVMASDEEKMEKEKKEEVEDEKTETPEHEQQEKEQEKKDSQNPALPSEKKEDDEEEDDDKEDKKEESESAKANQNILSSQQSSAQKVEEKIITQTKTCVTLNTATMKIESIDQLKTLWPELRKLESVAAVEDFVNAIQKGNAEWEQKLNAEKDLVKNLEQSKAEAEQRATQLESSLAEVQKQVEDLKAAQAVAEATQKFQERMASLDEEFDLDDEDRQIIAEDIKGLSDESFAAYQKKCAKLMCGKKKGKAMGPVSAPVQPAVAAVVAPVAPAAPVVPVAEAFASVTPIEGQTQIPAGTSQVNVDLKTEMAEAFDGAIKVGGRSVKDRRAEKAAKQPKE